MAKTRDEIAALPPIDLLYLGLRPDRDGKRWHAYVDVTGMANDGDPLPADKPILYWKKRFDKGPVGWVTRVPCEEQGDSFAVYPAHATGLGRWKNDGDVVRWAALHRSAELELAQAGKLAAEMRRRLDREALAPFRDAYRKATWKQRQMLLAYVIAEITG